MSTDRCALPADKDTGAFVTVLSWVDSGMCLTLTCFHHPGERPTTQAVSEISWWARLGKNVLPQYLPGAPAGESPS